MQIRVGDYNTGNYNTIFRNCSSYSNQDANYSFYCAAVGYVYEGMLIINAKFIDCFADSGNNFFWGEGFDTSAAVL